MAKLEITKWTEWLAHTNFSFLQGASHPHEMLDTAQAYGYSGLGVCDMDGAYGLARTHKHWKTLDSEKRPRLYHGTEIHLEKDHHRPFVEQNTLALIARSASGYANLCKILTRTHKDGKRDAHISLEDLSSMSLTDISVIIPMRGLLRQMTLADSKTTTEKLWEKQCKTVLDIFGKDHCYLAISRHLSPSEDIWIHQALKTQRQLGLKTLLSTDPFMHCRSRKKLSDLLTAIRTNMTLDDAVAHSFVNDERCLLTIPEINQRFAHLPILKASLEYSEALAESCHFSFDELRYRYPKEMIPPGHTAQSYLTAMTWTSAQETYGEQLPPKIRTLLTHELALIETLGFADYFLTVWDIVSWARKQGILCQGRGSAANSAVCFVLGITAVDPSKFDILFERFMSVERGDPPDIDVDFEHERREEVIQYIYRRYGRDKASMVANVITFRTKGAIRACGKALGISDEILSDAAELLSSRVNAGKSPTDIFKDLKTTKEDKNLPWKLWLEMSKQLKGFPRHLGIHSGGFMIADRPLSELVPQEPATMEGRSVIQWCKDDIEDLGFFKIDILALGMLSAVRKSLQMIKESYGHEISLATIPQEDTSTYKMIQRADTVGTFQVESRAQMSMLPKLLPRTFYDLVVEVAIIRPGPIQGGMVHPYLRRRHGLEPITYPDERLRPILHRTLGIPIFQEQVMRIAMAVGSFTPGEANELRKNMGAWTMRGDINPWLERLAEGMQKNGISPEFASAILSQMRGFAEYGFPESHAVSFALIAYASCYLKCHYPAAFFAALLNSQPMGFYQPHALVQAAKRQSIAVLPICITQSDWSCKLEAISNHEPKEFASRLGFNMIKGLSKKTALHIEDTRRRTKPWATWESFLKHTKVPRHELTILASANAFTVFGLPRRSAIWIAAAAPHAQWLEDLDLGATFTDETTQQAVQQDFQSFQTSLHQHPAEVIRSEHWCYPVTQSKVKRAKDLEDLIPNQVIHVFGMILIEQRPPSANGMMFITLEDETGFINLALTPEIIERNSKKISGQSFLCVSGKLQRQGISHSILVREVMEPMVSKADVITLPSAHDSGYPTPAKAANIKT
ncbi:MAG: error-prone DNA polymerase [bacterium]